MLTVRSGPAAGLVAQIALLVALAAAVDLGVLGWAVGLGCGVVLDVAVAAGLVRSGAAALGPADVITLTRATLACGVAALTAESFVRSPAVALLVAVAAVALALDAVDGLVARRTHTASVFGAQFDGEADAFLILVLSVYVAQDLGGWVLLIGAARYVFALAGWPLPWLRRRLPFRYWRKVVTAAQGIVLTVVAADVLPRSWAYVALLAALALLAESFGRDVWWLWRRRAPADVRRARAVVAVGANVVSLTLVWFALVVPNELGEVTAGSLLRLPVEGLVLVALALVLPDRARRAMVWTAGPVLGLVALVKVVDMGFYTALDRPFSPLTDRGYFGPALDVVRDSFGQVVATATLVVAVLLVLAFLLCMPVALRRLTRLVLRHRTWTARGVVALGVVWVLGAASGVQLVGDRPFASSDAGRLAVGKVGGAVTDARDLEQFEVAVGTDPYQGSSGLLSGLRGKDVLVVFVESYGRVAVEGLPSSPRVRAVLDESTRRLQEAGFSSRSAFLSSPTFGALSWLAHSSLHSGLWVDNQLRYERLLAGDRATLSQIFGREGWRTVALKPSNTEAWPEGKAFYRYDEVYGNGDLGYRGPAFGFSDMPDQFALWAFQRLELARSDRAPVMAEVDLASSHSPWAPVPEMVGWDELGDGSVFRRMHDRVRSAEDLVRHPDQVQAAYAGSIVYCLRTVVSFVEEYGDEDLVVVLVGDHQPSPVVSGHDASRDVPITLIAHDPAVMARITSWDWQEGMRPDPAAPVWPMDAFRDRFLAAYGAAPPATSLRQPARAGP